MQIVPIYGIKDLAFKKGGMFTPRPPHTHTKNEQEETKDIIWLFPR